MPSRKDLVSLLTTILVSGCGGTTLPAESPSHQPKKAVARAEPPSEARLATPTPEPPGPAADSESDEPEPQPSTTADSEAAPTPEILPSSCASTGDFCVPPPAFADRLCAGKNPDVAVYMMQKGQPWTHGYIRVENVDTINTLGGPAGEAKLAFGEEVLVLRAGAQKSGGIQMSGMGGFIVLRWDGTCATLAEHELVTWVPGQMSHAPLVWKYLGPAAQNALLENKSIRAARKQHREECRGSSFGRSPECLKATDQLNEAIVVAVRSGTKVPFPERIR